MPSKPTNTTDLRPGATRVVELNESDLPAADHSLGVAVGRADGQLATTAPSTGIALGVFGDINKNDNVMPTINIVNGNGAMSEKFEKGNIILNREELLSEGEEAVELTVLSIRKKYVENLEWGGDQRPRVFDTLEQVTAAGGHCEWQDGEKPPFSPAADALIVVRSSKELPNLPFEFEGKHHAVVLWHMTGTAYNRAAKLIITAAQWSLRSGLINGSWTLTSKSEKIGKNTVFVPVLKAGPRNPEALVEFYKSLAA